MAAGESSRGSNLAANQFDAHNFLGQPRSMGIGNTTAAAGSSEDSN